MINMIKKIIVALYRRYWTSRIRRAAKKCGHSLTVNRKSFVGKNTILGNNVNFNGMRIAGDGETIIGDNFHSGQDCLIHTAIHNYDQGSMIPYDKTYIKKNVVIGNNVWFGDRVIVLGNATIGEGSVIQAGSVVVGDIPPLAVAGGNPAKVFKYRDKQHYENLKSQGRFL